MSSRPGGGGCVRCGRILKHERASQEAMGRNRSFGMFESQGQTIYRVGACWRATKGSIGGKMGGGRCDAVFDYVTQGEEAGGSIL